MSEVEWCSLKSGHLMLHGGNRAFVGIIKDLKVKSAKI